MNAYLKFEFADNVKIDRTKADELEDFFASDNTDVSGFRDVKIITDNDGNLIDIELDEYWNDFTDAHVFAKKLQECIISGIVDLYFEYEDGGSEWICVLPKDLSDPLYFRREWTFVGGIY